jgi:hypothetical protein
LVKQVLQEEVTALAAMSAAKVRHWLTPACLLHMIEFVGNVEQLRQFECCNYAG